MVFCAVMLTKLCFRGFLTCQPIRSLSNMCLTLETDVCNRKLSSMQVLKYHKRLYAPHPPFPYPEIPSKQAAKSFVVHLDDRGRSLLLEELTRCQQEVDATPVTIGADVPPVSSQQFKDIMLYHGIPFIGFGILDNMIMIIAGEYIDATLGAALGISTMAAAALGNLISDLAGVGTAGYVELLASKIGVHPPDITPVQALTKRVRYAVGLGRGLGITIGCLIGMFPLLFFKDDDKKADSKSIPEISESNTQKSSS